MMVKQWLDDGYKHDGYKQWLDDGYKQELNDALLMG